MLQKPKHLIEDNLYHLNIVYFHQNRVLKTFWCRKNHELISQPDKCPLGNI